MDILSKSSDFIALLALAVSGYGAWKTIRFNERQKSLIETQERLNRLLLEKEQEQAATNKKADLGATIVRLENFEPTASRPIVVIPGCAVATR
jgi:hypothetical protein